jgi:ribonuclease T
VSNDEQVAARPDAPTAIAKRFRGFLPVIIDVETGGFNCGTDALLELAAVFVRFDTAGNLETSEHHRYIVKPFEGSRLDPASLQVTGIDPFHPLRPAIDEGDALRGLFQGVRRELKQAVERTGIKRNPFHPFSSFDTATLGGVAFGQTVLSRAVTAAGFEWDDAQAHSALYDAEMTAKIFCAVVNRFRAVYES